MLPLLLLFLTPQQVDLSKKITFQSRAQRLERLIPELSKASGVPMKYTLKTENDILVIDVKDVSIKALMDKMAEVDQAEWLKKPDGTYSFERSEAQEKQALDAELTERSKAYGAEAQKLFEQTSGVEFTAKLAAEMDQTLTAWDIAKSKSGSNEDEGLPFTEGEHPMFKYGPAARALFRLAPLIDWRTVATMPTSSRIAFATKPNKNQIAFKGETVEIVEMLRTEQGLWHSPQKEGVRGGISGVDPRLYRTVDPNSIDSLVISVQLNMVPQLFFYALGQDGQTVLTTYWTLNPAAIHEIFKTSSKAYNAVPDFTLTKTSWDYARLTSSDPKVKIPLTPEWAERLIRVDLHDPLSYAISDFLIATAGGSKSQLVAAPPDYLALMVQDDCRDGKINLKAVREKAEKYSYCNFEERDGWLLVTPKHRASERAYRDDRMAASVFLRTVRENGQAGLQELGEYARNVKDSAIWTCVYSHSAALAFGSEKMVQEADLSALRVYSLLTDVQKAHLMRGGQLPVAELREEAVPFLTWMVYRDTNAFNRFFMPRDPKQHSRLVGNDEPSIVAPDGLRNSSLRFKVKEYPGVAARSGGDGHYSPWTRFLSAVELGRGLGQGTSLKEDDFFLGTIREIQFIIDLNDLFMVQTRLIQTDIDLTTKALTYAELPEEFRRTAEAAIIERKASQPSKPPPP